MFRDYYACRAWLENFIPLVYGKEELGLTRIEELLKLLGNPQNKFKSIHIAGTSGKGSTAFYTAKLLQEAGYKRSLRFSASPAGLKVGLHVSPHLVYIGERMQIFSPLRHPEFSSGSKKILKQVQNDSEGFIPIDKFLKLFNQIRVVVDKIKKDKPDLTPSYFEILVAASFLYFAQEKVDFAVIEVGLGGRLDATNVLQSRIAVITNIGLDHTEILGRTIEKIAAEKAGIIKNGVPVVTGCPSTHSVVRLHSPLSVRSGSSTSGRALKVIEKVAKEKKAPLIKLDTQSGKISTDSDTFSYITKPSYTLRYKPIDNVSDNLKLAVVAVLALGVLVDQRSIDKVERQVFPGRFEEIESGVVLDGAHNPDKIRALLEFIREFQISKNILRANDSKSRSSRPALPAGRQARTISNVTLVLAFKKGKNWKKMVDILINNLPVEGVYCTMFNSVTDTGKFSAVSPQEILDYVNGKWKMVNGKFFENSQQAVFEALQSSVIASTSMSLRAERSNLSVNSAKQSQKQIATGSSNPRNDSLVLVTGSLYLVGEVRTMWQLPSFA